jgi:hypothetical protein
MSSGLGGRFYFVLGATIAGLLVLSLTDLSALRRGRQGRDAPFAASLHALRRQADLLGP